MRSEPETSFGIYIHWPFCAAKCPYCDFNSHVRQAVDHEQWRQALIEDLNRQAQELDAPTVTSVFFGGGTPSLMEPATVDTLLVEIQRLFSVDTDLEVTLEANPTSVEAEKFAAFRTAGVNRISMGIQSLNDHDLRRLGRMHTVAEAQGAFDIARRLFDRVSFDLIYARQDQSVADWEVELSQALNMAVDHLSLYQLTIEAGTRFGDLAARNRLSGLPDTELAAEMFEVTRSVCADAGMPAYEVSNHGRPGSECRHNLTYWRYDPYLGIGPGAHGRVCHDGDWLATTSVLKPELWLAGDNRTQYEAVGPRDRGVEMLLMSLRMTEGLDLEKFSRISGAVLDETHISDLMDAGLLSKTNRHLKVTEAGFLVLNTIISQLAENWRPL